MSTKWTNESPYEESMIQYLITSFKKGESMEEFCAHFDISENTFYKWVKSKPDFAEAYEKAQAKAKAYFLKLGREYMVEENEGARINLGLYNRTMNTRFNLPAQRKLKIKGIAKKKIEDKMHAVMKAVDGGELTSMEATQMSRVIEAAMKVSQHTDLEKRLEQIEQAQKIGVDDGEFKEVEE